MMDIFANLKENFRFQPELEQALGAIQKELVASHDEIASLKRANNSLKDTVKELKNKELCDTIGAIQKQLVVSLGEIASLKKDNNSLIELLKELHVAIASVRKHQTGAMNNLDAAIEHNKKIVKIFRAN